MDGLVKRLTGQPDRPKHRGYEYTLLDKCQEYEKRCYPAATWVCTAVNSVYQDTANVEAFRTLQAYASGQNEAGAQLRMQPPILTRVSPHDGFSFERNFVVSAFLGPGKDGRQPQPTNPNVYIDYLPPMTVFVKTFQGVASEERLAHETRRLVQCLSCREEIRTDTYFTATYDSPYQLAPTKNEIWVLEFNKHTAIETFRKKQEFVQMGTRRLELPTYISMPLYFTMGFVVFLSSALKYSLTAFDTMKSNWAYVNACRLNVTGSSILMLSAQSVVNIAQTAFTTCWKVTLGVLKSW